MHCASFCIVAHFRIAFSHISHVIIQTQYHLAMWSLQTVVLSCVLFRVDTISEDVFGKVSNPLQELRRFINVTNVVSLSRIQCAGQCRILRCTIWKHVNASNMCVIGYLDPIGESAQVGIVPDPDPNGNYSYFTSKSFKLGTATN